MDEPAAREIFPDRDYYFSCSCCGDCCCGKITIELNLYDLYKLGRYLGFTHSRELVERKWIRFQTAQNALALPQMIFRKRPVHCCPFLENHLESDGQVKGLCALHPDIKPLVCMLAPVSREVDFGTHLSRFMLVAPTDQCPGMGAGAPCRLVTLEREFKRELDYEYRYYHLLDNYIQQDAADPQLVAGLFDFSLKREFGEILSGKEARYPAIGSEPCVQVGGDR